MTTGAARVEVAPFVFEGRTFTALGSAVDHDKGRVTGYPKGTKLMSWDGRTQIGTLTVVSSKATPRSQVSSHVVAYRAVVDGIAYHGRGTGDGMVLHLKKSKR